MVGEQPVLAPASALNTPRGVPLPTASGFMTGRYQMVSESGERFEIDVPTFSLDSPRCEAGVELDRGGCGIALMHRTILAVTVHRFWRMLFCSARANALVGADIADRTVQRYTVVIASQKGRCSGVVMAQDIVLTAAHCIQPGEKLNVGGTVGGGEQPLQAFLFSPVDRGRRRIRSTSRPTPARRIWRC